MKLKRDTTLRIRKIFINNYLLSCRIGVDPHELKIPQPVRINITCEYIAPDPEETDDVSQVVDYRALAHRIKDSVEGHIYFLENLAEHIAGMCLEDQRVRSCVVKLEKLNAIQEADSVGVEITRYRN